MNQLINIYDFNEIKTNDFQAFDKVLCNYENLNKNPGDGKRLKKYVIRCLISIGGNPDEAIDCSDNSVEDNAKNMLDRHIELKNKEELAFCYLRLISSKSFDWISIPPWRPKVITFLDSIFYQDLYNEWKIDEKLQSHEKVKQLEEIVPKQERLLDNVLDSLTSLDRVLKIRTQLMKGLNDKTGKLLFIPLLPPNTIALLSDVFDKCQKYIDQKSSLSVKNSYDEVLDAICILNNQLGNFGTTYSWKLLTKFGEVIKIFIDDDFKNNVAAQPADVTIKPSLKKYPFHNVGMRVNLDFFLTNLGPGYAYDTKIEIVLQDDSLISIESPIVIVGQLLPNEIYPIQINAEINDVCSEIDVYLNLSWRNFDSEVHDIDIQEKLLAQRTDINWESLAETDPYSLEPINDVNQLVGRKDVLRRLKASLNAPNTGSFTIQGQKRVGKTSIAKVLQSLLASEGILTVYVEAGDFMTPSADTTLKRLGVILCRKLPEVDHRLDMIIKPSFDDGISAFCDFVDDINKILIDKKIVFFIDEFDQLNIDLYLKGIWGDSFFSTLRALSSRPLVGFVLVGGERMVLIMENQGIQLNKWVLIPVDYFSKEKDWSDYHELIQRPALNILDFSIEAIQELHELTAGNPYFTKLICQYIFRAAVESRDCSICQMEVNNAVDQAIIEIKHNTFQHFWDDRIFSSGEKATEISLRRRRVLIALADILRLKESASGLELKNHPLLRDSINLESELKEFVTRKVLDGDISGPFDNNHYKYKVKFFLLWMKNQGIQDIIATFSELDAALKEKQKEEEAKIKSEKILELCNSWGNYKGKHITSENIRAWLEQFTGLNEQKIMFSVLKGLKFYGNSFLREKMKEVHTIAMRSITRTKAYRQLKRDDILVSYLDAIEKSGASLARLYADEANVVIGNVIEKGNLLSKLEETNQIQAVVFLDDFVGTGHQAVENLTKITETIGAIVQKKKIKIIFFAVVAVIDGWKYLSEKLADFNLDIETHYCDLLSNEDKYFSNSSKLFPDEDIRISAKSIAEKYGRQLIKDNPLGYGSLGVAVVFEHGCPNDSLPILWVEKTSPNWVPLFKRL